MLRIGDTIFSFDVLEKRFKCNLPECLGNCCRYGDSGAPLSDSEAEILEKIWTEVKPYLRPEGVRTIEEKGTSTADSENELVTPLIESEECAYAILKDNIYMCGIEKAWSEGKISFQKPLSCHLFPVRIKQFSGFRAVNYQELSICSSACERGREEGIYVYEFLEEPLIKAVGSETYRELCIAADELRKQNYKNT
ncbi:MAG: hypothetical protein A2V64_07110 [Bacteroidetes bacterium RBG_13_43_22]|nr:MAG: hypothetical protein A2V64_07110 [Bacteroidetes bacterium RBG_13_43_22]